MSRPKITDLDKTIAVIEQKIDDGFKQNSKEHLEVFALINKIEEKKADKDSVNRLENVMRWAAITITGIIIGALGYLLKLTLIK